MYVSTILGPDFLMYTLMCYTFNINVVMYYRYVLHVCMCTYYGKKYYMYRYRGTVVSGTHTPHTKRVKGKH